MLGLLRFIIIIITIIIIIKRGRQCKTERVIYTISVRRPQHQPIDRKKIKGNIVEDYSRDIVGFQEQGQYFFIGPALEIRQSHTIECGVRKIVPEGRTLRGEQQSLVLRGSAARHRLSIPLCDQSTACNPQ